MNKSFLILKFSLDITLLLSLIAFPLINLLTSLFEFSNLDKITRSIMFKDLARSLGVGSLRIVEVIQGRETIGIEIPNADREDVLLGEVISSKVFEESKSVGIEILRKKDNLKKAGNILKIKK